MGETNKETLQKIKEHLELLGYKLKSSSKDGTTLATIDEGAFFFIIPDEKNNIIYFLTLTNTTKDEFTSAMFESINEFNKGSSFSSFYCDKQDPLEDGKKHVCIFMKTTYEGEYDKKTFSMFFNKLKNDELRMQISKSMGAFI